MAPFQRVLKLLDSQSHWFALTMDHNNVTFPSGPCFKKFLFGFDIIIPVNYLVISLGYPYCDGRTT